MSQEQQGQIDELCMNTSRILSMDVGQHGSSQPEGYGMKRGGRAREATHE